MSQKAVTDALTTVKKILRGINYVGMSIWWYDGRTLADGFCGGVKAEGYQTLIGHQFSFDHINNYCYSGNSLAATSVGDASSIMESKASSWSASGGDIWTLDTITNDFKRNIPMGTIDDYLNNTGNLTYYGALRSFKDKVLSLSGNKAIVICANGIRRNNAGYTSTSENTEGLTMTDYEYALMNVAARNNWYFIDQFRLTSITDLTVMLSTIDGLHLNNFGYKQAVKPWIEQLNIITNIHKDAFDYDIITGSYVSTTGVLTSNANYSRTSFIPVSAGETYIYYGKIPAAATVVSSVYGFDSSQTPKEMILGYNIDATDGYAITIPPGVSYIVCTSHSSGSLSVEIPQSESWYEVTGTKVTSRYLKSDGTVASGLSHWWTYGYISVSTGAYRYTGSTIEGTPTVVSVCGYDASQNFVSVLVGNGDYSTSPIQFNVPTTVKYIKFTAYDTKPIKLETLI